MPRLSLLAGLLITLYIHQVAATDVGSSFDTKNEHAFEHDFGSFPYKTFRSSDLIAPVLRKPYDSPECHDDNYIFLSPRGYQVTHPAIMIMDNAGEMVWEHYVDGQGYNLKVQEYQGERVLTFWVGDDGIGGHGEGDYYMYNSRYEQIAKISALNGLHADLHEMTITPQGTALITIYEVHPVTSPGFVEDADVLWIWDCLFQEIDIATNNLIFEWRASDHHSLNETFREIHDEGRIPSRPWDWYHINSIEKDELGNYLVSARYTHTITYINGSTGAIIWVLGGKRNVFEDLSDGESKATNIAYQHFARLHNLTEFPELLANEMAAHPMKDVDGVTKILVSAFDNGADNEGAGHRPSRGVLIELTYPTRESSAAGTGYTARLIREYIHPARIISSSQGSMQLVPSNETSDPKVLLGYGYVGVWTEFSADGQVLCDNRYSAQSSWGKGDVQSYRVLKAAWRGEPSWPPEVAFGDGEYQPSVFVSWNGATEVMAWRLQQANESACVDDGWEDVLTTQKTGFETEVEASDVGLRFLRVVGLDVDGVVLGVSETLDLGWQVGVNGVFDGLQTGANSRVHLAIMCVAALTLFVIGYESFGQIKRWTETRWLGYEQVHSDGRVSPFA